MNKGIESKKIRSPLPDFLIRIGVEGFEPPGDGVRVRCLTAWRHPSVFAALVWTAYTVYHRFCILSSVFSKKIKNIFGQI